MALADPYTHYTPSAGVPPLPAKATNPARATSGTPSGPGSLPLAEEGLRVAEAPLSPAPLHARKPTASALRYQRTQVETASPTRLVILLYEGAIRFCQLAQDAMARKDLPAQHENLIKAQRIVSELLGSLNRDQGGAVAENLTRLYTHMLEQLVHANLYDQAAPVQAVQAMLRDLRASWLEVERLNGAK